jgi:hypothetical protein
MTGTEHALAACRPPGSGQRRWNVVSAKDTEVTELTSQAVPSGSRKRCKCFHCTEDADNSVPNPVTLKDWVRRAVCHFIDEQVI